MRSAVRALIVLALCSAAAGLAAFWVVKPEFWGGRGPARPGPGPSGNPGADRPSAKAKAAEGKGKGAMADLYFDPRGFEDGGFGVASRYTGPLQDDASPKALKAAIEARFPRGLEALKAEYDGLKAGDPPTREQVAKRVGVERSLGLLYMYAGKFPEAAEWTEKALADAKANPGAVAKDVRADLTAVRGVIALRRGEVENCLGCLGPSACIFPIAVEATHKNPSGSNEAVRWFTDYLEERPGDLRVLWLLNLAYMTLGQYPEGVPTKYRLPVEMFKSKADFGRFENVAMRVGLDARGPNLAGGSVFDDLTGDGLPDLFSTSLDATKGASLFVNKGDGTFQDRSKAANLDEQVYALNVTRADYDNDGDLDLLMLRGGWEFPARLSLLKNRGDGVFDDATDAAGLGTPIQTEAAAWGDFDNDGKVDLFVCGEFLPPGAGESDAVKRDPRNRCRLYRNLGDGTFTDVAPSAGVEDDRCAKGVAWGDYDGDGRLDLFVSNMGQPCRLYRNLGDGKFLDVAPELGVTGPAFSFACWFWDYDNDGRLDLYVNDYRASVGEAVASNAGVALEGGSRPALYRNEGKGRFRDVTESVGLARAMAPMGSNFGDVDNDGFPDFYLGTGSMSYSGLDPDLLFHNNGGFRFDDITTSSGTGHLQKGHGVSFADWDNDGDLDLFVELGGGTPGDQAYNVLFQNPGHEGHFLKVKLVGAETNRAALGARIKADFPGAGGETRSVYRTVGNNSSFGGNSLVELIGLAAATKATLTVSWPTSGTTQTFPDLAAGRYVEITEGQDAPKDVTLPKLTPPKGPKS